MKKIFEFFKKAPWYRKVIIFFSIVTIALLLIKLFDYINLTLALKDVKMAFINYRLITDKILYSQNLDGTDLLCLTDEHGRHESPLWSPDGWKLIYLYKPTGNRNFTLFIIDSDGNNKIQLTDYSEYVWSLNWSSDSNRVLYSSRENNGNFNIFVVNIDGKNRNQLTFQEGHKIRSDWSSDNRYIIYEKYFTEGADGNIFIMEANGNNNKKLTDSDCIDMCPEWSPDGKKIMFIRIFQNGNREIFTVNPDGSDLKNLTCTDNSSEWFASWSPDGKKIAFQSDRDGNIEIYVMDRDGKNVTRLTYDNMIDWFPVWHPDGKWIAFNSDRGNEMSGSSIYMVNLKGRNLTSLTHMEGRENFPSMIFFQ